MKTPILSQILDELSTAVAGTFARSGGRSHPDAQLLPDFTATSLRRIRPLELESLEPRVLYSGAPAPSPEPAPLSETAPAQEQPAEPVTDSTGEASAEVSSEPYGGVEETSPPEITGESVVPVATPTAADESGVVAETDVSVGATLSSELTTQSLADLADAAAQRWIDSGLSDLQVAALAEIDYGVVDLEGNLLGEARGNYVSIDPNAAGRGWFVDPTPLADEEFTMGGPGELLSDFPGMDLLTVILHEQGHVLGLGDTAVHTSDLLYDGLVQGQRRLPSEGQAFAMVPGSQPGSSFLTGTAEWSITGGGTGDEGTVADYTIGLTGTFSAGESVTITVDLEDTGTGDGDVNGSSSNEEELYSVLSALAGGRADLEFATETGRLTFTAQGEGVTMADIDFSLTRADDTVVENEEAFEITLSRPSEVVYLPVDTGSVRAPSWLKPFGQSILFNISDEQGFAEFDVSGVVGTPEARIEFEVQDRGTFGGTQGQTVTFDVATYNGDGAVTAGDLGTGTYLDSGSLLVGEYVDFEMNVAEPLQGAKASTGYLGVKWYQGVRNGTSSDQLDAVDPVLVVTLPTPSSVTVGSGSVVTTITDDDRLEWYITGTTTGAENTMANYTIGVNGGFGAGGGASVIIDMADSETNASDLGGARANEAELYDALAEVADDRDDLEFDTLTGILTFDTEGAEGGRDEKGGEIWMEDIEFGVFLADDSLVEADETFNIALSSPAANIDISTTRGDVDTTITDNDSARWSIAGGGAASEGVAADYTVSLAGVFGSGGSVSVSLDLSDSETDDGDVGTSGDNEVDLYNALAAVAAGRADLSFDVSTGALTYTAQSEGTMMADIDFSLDREDDAVMESPESFDITLSIPSPQTAQVPLEPDAIMTVRRPNWLGPFGDSILFDYSSDEGMAEYDLSRVSEIVGATVDFEIQDPGVSSGDQGKPISYQMATYHGDGTINVSDLDAGTFFWEGSMIVGETQNNSLDVTTEAQGADSATGILGIRWYDARIEGGCCEQLRINDDPILVVTVPKGGTVDSANASVTTTILDNEVFWEGDVSDAWTEPGNWLGDQVPGATNTAVFDDVHSVSTLVDVTGSAEVGSVAFVNDTDDFTFAGSTVTTDRLMQTGDGTNTLNSSLTEVTGFVGTVSGGALLLNNDANILGTSSSFTVDPGGVLGGTGTLFGAVTISTNGTPGELDPGPGVGVIDVGNLNLAGVLEIEIAGADGAGTANGHDLIRVTGAVSLSGELELDTGGLTAGEVTPGAQFILIENDGSDVVNGTFNWVSEGAVVANDFGGSGLNAAITYEGGDGNDVVLFVVAPIDFDDAPASYGPASHFTTGPQLGLRRDADDQSFDTANADGDDFDGGTDDEDGVTFVGVTLAGQSSNRVDIEAPAGGRLDAWVDFDNDGTFGGVGEQIFDDLVLSAGTNELTFAVPGGAVEGDRVARFRISSAGDLDPSGTFPAADGEVEDHLVTISPPNEAGVDDGGNLDISGDGDVDHITVSIDGGNLRISIDDDSISGGSGTTTDTNGDVLVPLSGLNSININTGVADDTIEVSDLAGFTGSFTIAGGDGYDIIEFRADVTLGDGNDANLSGEEIDLFFGGIETTGSGSISVEGTGSTGGIHQGVHLLGSDLKASGTGTVTVSGHGGDAGANNAGVYLTNGSTISTTDGDIVIDGIGGGGILGKGATFLSGTSVSAGGSGRLIINGTASNSGTFANDGVYFAPGTTASVEDGDMVITGTGTGSIGLSRGVQAISVNLTSTGEGGITIVGIASGAGANNAGVLLTNTVIDTSGGSGAVVISGNGSPNGTTNNEGIRFSNVDITADAGGIDLDGSGGGVSTGYNNSGIALFNDSTLAALGNGTVTVDGTGGSGTNANTGVYLNGATVSVTSMNGAISINGTGSGTGNSNRGIGIFSATVTSTGTGTVTLRGTGSMSADSVSNSGVYLVSSTVSANTGKLTMSGRGGTGSSNNGGVRIQNSAVTTSGTLGIDGIGHSGTTGTGNSGVYIYLNSTVNGNALSTITGTGGEGSLLNYGILMNTGITSNVDLENIIGIATDGNSADEFGDFFSILPILAMAEAGVRSQREALQGMADCALAFSPPEKLGLRLKPGDGLLFSGRERVVKVVDREVLEAILGDENPVLPEGSEGWAEYHALFVAGGGIDRFEGELGTPTLHAWLDNEATIRGEIVESAAVTQQLVELRREPEILGDTATAPSTWMKLSAMDLV